MARRSVEGNRGSCARVPLQPTTLSHRLLTTPTNSVLSFKHKQFSTNIPSYQYDAQRALICSPRRRSIAYRFARECRSTRTVVVGSSCTEYDNCEITLCAHCATKRRQTHPPLVVDVADDDPANARCSSARTCALFSAISLILSAMRCLYSYLKRISKSVIFFVR